MLGMAGDGLCLFLKIEGLWNWENIFFFCKSEFLHAYHSHLTFMPKYPGGVLNSEHPFRRLQERADSPLSARRAAKWNPAVMFHKPRVHVASSVGHRWPLGRQTGCAGWQRPHTIMRHAEPKSSPGDSTGSHDPFALCKRNGSLSVKAEKPWLVGTFGSVVVSPLAAARGRRIQRVIVRVSLRLDRQHAWRAASVPGGKDLILLCSESKYLSLIQSKWILDSPSNFFFLLPFSH